MEDKLKVYTPEVVPDAGFPLQGSPTTAVTSSTQETANQTYGAKEMAEQGFPLKMVAKELLSTAINTVTKKITKAFEFTKSGALQIGEYINGVSGDIRISPDGITARNNAGNTTFSLDGDTGDAIFTGDVRASTFTSDYFNVDERGNVIARSIKFLDSATANDFAGSGYREIAGSEAYSSSPPYLSITRSNRNLQYVPGLEIDLNLLNDSRVRFDLLIYAAVRQTAAQELVAETYYFRCPVFVVEIIGGSWALSSGNPVDVLTGTVLVDDTADQDTDIDIYSIRYAAQVTNETFIGCTDYPETFRASNIVSVNAGEHTYKVLADPKTLRFDSFWNSEARLYVYRSRLTATTLGSV